MTTSAIDAGDLVERARVTRGSSEDAIYQMVAAALRRRGAGGHLIDVGCGTGALWRLVQAQFASYCGIDAVRYDGYPLGADFHQADLDALEWPIDPEMADAVVAVETIEHLENPWAFMRGLVRLAKPGAWIVVTTPNQLSALSLITLLVKQRFSAFQDAHYPAHRTSLLESDLRRVAASCRLVDVEIGYTSSGRVPLTPWHYPRLISGLSPRALSDNLMLVGKKPLW